MFKTSTYGFTLIELLIVVAIIAILVSIAIPSYMVIKDMAREAATEAEMRNVASALEIYYEDYFAYPTTSESLAVIEDKNYLKSVPFRDKWGREYEYTSSGKAYTFSSSGLDGIYGNDDDIVISNGAMVSSGRYSDGS